MNDIIFMQVFDALQYTPNNILSIALGKLALLGQTFEEFSADCQFKREIVFFPRFEPFVEFDLYRESKVSPIRTSSIYHKKDPQYSDGPSL